MSDLDMIGRECACFQTRMTARALTRAYDAALRPSGLKVTQFSLLVAIAQEPDSSVKQLAALTAIERTTLLRNLALLVSRGYVTARSGGGRVVHHDLTDEGRARLEAALPLWRSAQAAVVDRLGAGRWDEMRSGLKALRRSVA